MPKAQNVRIIDQRRGVTSGEVTRILGGSATGDHGALAGLADNDHPQYILASLLTTRGDLIRRGASTPERYGLVVPASPTINVLAVKNGELDPTWQSASANPGAAASLLQSNASGQLQLVGLIAGYVRPASNSTTALQLQTAGGTAVVTVDTTNGRVGIGTTPSTDFEIYKSGADAQAYIYTGTSGRAGLTLAGYYVSPSPGFGKARAGAFISLRNLDATANNYAFIDFSDAGNNPVAGIAGIFENDANNAGALAFYSRPSGGNLSERLKIGSNGTITINDIGDAAADLRAESDTEANMVWLDASADLLYLGGSTNGVQVAKGGALTLIGTAKYIRHIQIPAVLTGNPANQPTAVDFFTVGGLQFATTGAKYAYCQWEMPDDWDGTDIYFEVDWFPDSGAMSGTDAVRWTVEYRAIAEGELVNQGTSVTLDNGVGGDTGDHAQYKTVHSRMTLAYNNANQPLTKQDHLFFKVSRDTGVSGDFGGTVTVPAFEIIYTSTGFPTN